jgi:hypothetical protein
MAKHRSFKLEKFVTGVNSDLLKTYFTRKNVSVADVYPIDTAWRISLRRWRDR